MDELQIVIDEHTAVSEALSALWQATYGIGKSPDGKQAIKFKRLKLEYDLLDAEIHILAARLGVLDQLEGHTIMNRPPYQTSEARH